MVVQIVKTMQNKKQLDKKTKKIIRIDYFTK